MTETVNKPTSGEILQAIADVDDLFDDAADHIPGEPLDPYDLECSKGAIDEAIRYLEGFDAERTKGAIDEAARELIALRRMVEAYVGGDEPELPPSAEFRWTFPQGEDRTPVDPLVGSAVNLLVATLDRLNATLGYVNDATTDDGIVGSLLEVSGAINMLKAIEGCIAARQMTR